MNRFLTCFIVTENIFPLSLSNLLLVGRIYMYMCCGMSLGCLPVLWSLDIFCTSSLKRSWLLLHSPWQQGVLWSYNYTQQQGVKDFLETIKNIVSFPSAAIT